jgi:uncharacterized radical SAM superfamily Fe-S cluster-containing enzyme
LGFQIFQDKGLQFQPYFGLDGETAPDVRCSLINKERLLASRPLPNYLLNEGWEKSWYRALEDCQKIKGLVSPRGGSTEFFYVHPQNYRKANRWVWYTIQQGIKHLNIPDSQIGKPEVSGNIFSWCLPKRDEELIIILYVDEYCLESLKKTLITIINQNHTSFGLIVINNTGSNDFLTSFRQNSFGGFSRYTIIDLEYSIPYNEAIYTSIHYYISNQNSFICILLQGDLLLYNSLLQECLNRLEIYKADVLIGKEISERVLPKIGISRSNFLHPRIEPDTLVNGLSVFRKYLFDSLSHLDMKVQQLDSPKHIPAFSKIKKTHRWLDDITNISIMTPIVELSNNPIRFDHFNVLRRRNITETQVRDAINFVQQKAPKEEGKWEIGRKKFHPNTSKIEIDITYDCNLKCFHCNRSCTQAPTQAHMTLEQINKFVAESITMGKKWLLINILGGEPTLHPQFHEIIHVLLYDYLIPHSPETTLQITSNGYGDQVKLALDILPRHPNLVIDYNSFKEDRMIPYFTPFNLAPCDDSNSNNHEYHKGCWVTSYCGIGLNHLGYFACGVAGGIERILMKGKVVDSLLDLDDYLEEQLNTYCRLCGNFTAYAENYGDFMERAEKDIAPKTAMSETWKKLYKSYNNE